MTGLLQTEYFDVTHKSTYIPYSTLYTYMNILRFSNFYLLFLFYLIFLNHLNIHVNPKEVKGAGKWVFFFLLSFISLVTDIRQDILFLLFCENKNK